MLQRGVSADYIWFGRQAQQKGAGGPNKESRSAMTEFNEREKAFEAKFKRDEELRFKATARRNRLLGEWAAAQMGLSKSEAEVYAKDVVKADFAKPGDDDVLQKVLADLQGKGVDISDRLLRRRMDELMETAIEQVQTEG